MHTLARPSQIRFFRSTVRALLALALLSALACAPAEETAEVATAPAEAPFTLGLPAEAEQAAERITEEALRSTIAKLSADRLEGRGPGSEGDVLTRRHLIQQMELLGLEPGAADGGWEQRFQIVGVNATTPEVWRFEGEGGALDLRHWDEYIAASGVQSEEAVIDDAELVFVGYGIDAPEHDWDDFKGTDLRGKVLVMLNNDPDWDDDLFAGDRRLYYGRWTYKYESAARQGAAGAIIIHTDPSAGYPWQVVQTSWTGVQFELPAGDEPRIQVAGWTSWDASLRLFAAAGQNLEEQVEAAKSRGFQPVPLGLKTSFRLRNEVSRDVETANVLGLLRGSDPELASEVVIYTGHHDHLGRGKPDATGDDIYNGALDNASGTGQVLAIARAFHALPQPPRRSILFAFVAAEEQGLLGSKHYAAYPTFHPGKIAANINYDAGNIWGRTRDLIFIGYGKSDLDRVVEAVATRQDRKVVADQAPDKGYFYRSDQFSLAKIGVPAIYLDGGVELRDADPGAAQEMIDAWIQNHYHQPSDEMTDDWRFDGLLEDALVGFYSGLHIANADVMPAWYPGDEFEAARLSALAAASGSTAAGAP